MTDEGPREAGPADVAAGLDPAASEGAAAGRLGGFALESSADAGSAGASRGPSRSLVGADLGGYRIERELGRGGMGVVYQARDPSAGRPVAVKVRGRSATPERTERFRREGEALARLRHRHVVAVHEMGRAGDLEFIVMQLVTGEGLDARLRDGGPLDPRHAASVAAKVARALEAAHALGVVHRDLKPANVLLDAEGEPVVTDFGLAHVEASPLTRTGDLLGTPGYMAPEQARGEAGRRTEPRVDVYALGATLFALLVGRPPFERHSLAATLLAIDEEPAPDPARLRPQVPAALASVVLRCLEKEPEARYPSAAALADELEGFLAGRSVRGLRPPRARLLRKAAAVGAGVVGLAGVLEAVSLLRAPEEAATAEAPPSSASPPPPTRAERAAAARRALAEAADAAPARDGLASGGPSADRAARAAAHLRGGERFAGEAGSDEVARALAADAAAGPLAVLTHAEDGDLAAGLFPAGEGVVTYGGDGRVARWSAGPTGPRSRSWSVSDWPLQVAAAVEGGLLVGGPATFARVVLPPVPRGTADVRRFEQPGVLFTLAASPSRGRAVAGGSMPSLAAWSAERPDAFRWVASFRPVTTVDLAFAREDALVAAHHSEADASWVEAWRLPGDERLARRRFAGRIAAVAAEGERVAVAFADGRLRHLDLPDLEAASPETTTEGTPAGLALLPRGRLLVALAADGGGWLEVRRPGRTGPPDARADEPAPGGEGARARRAGAVEPGAVRWRAPLATAPCGVVVDPAGARALVATEEGRVSLWALPW